MHDRVRRTAASFRNPTANGSSSCSAAFKRSIASLPDDTWLQGSCCSPMSLHRYREQIAWAQHLSSGCGGDADHHH